MLCYFRWVAAEFKLLSRIGHLFFPLDFPDGKHNVQMATILPPPSKKQKTADAKRAQEQQDIDSIPENLGSVRIQFHDAATGTITGPPVSVPVSDATTKNIELILNTLLGNVRLF